MEVSVIDLTERVGLPVKLVPAEEGWQLESWGGSFARKACRQVDQRFETRDENPNANTPRWLYWMYRDVRLPEHEDQIVQVVCVTT